MSRLYGDRSGLVRWWRNTNPNYHAGKSDANSDNHAEAKANAEAAAHATSSSDAVSELQKLESKRELARQLASSLPFVAGALTPAKCWSGSHTSMSMSMSTRLRVNLRRDRPARHASKNSREDA
jgi:hypothetical protein